MKGELNLLKQYRRKNYWNVLKRCLVGNSVKQIKETFISSWLDHSWFEKNAAPFNLAEDHWFTVNKLIVMLILISLNWFESTVRRCVLFKHNPADLQIGHGEKWVNILKIFVFNKKMCKTSQSYWSKNRNKVHCSLILINNHANTDKALIKRNNNQLLGVLACEEL